jgi:hypothetical protein
MKRDARIERLRVVMVGASGRPLASRSLDEPNVVFVTATCTCFARDGIRVEAPLTVGRVLFLLLATRGIVTMEQLIECIWGDRHDGGPDTATRRAYQIVSRANSLAAALQLTITCEFWHGWEMRDLRRSAEAKQLTRISQ